MTGRVSDYSYCYVSSSAGTMLEVLCFQAVRLSVCVYMIEFVCKPLDGISPSFIVLVHLEIEMDWWDVEVKRSKVKGHNRIIYNETSTSVVDRFRCVVLCLMVRSLTLRLCLVLYVRLQSTLATWSALWNHTTRPCILLRVVVVVLAVVVAAAAAVVSSSSY